MKTDDDAFWDEFGIAWRASIRDPGRVTVRVEARLRRQRLLISAATAAAGVVAVATAAMAAWAFWAGLSTQAWHFVTRGATLAVVGVLASVALFALRARNEPEAGSLREMLQSSAAQSRRLIRAADLGLAVLAVLAIGGCAGYVLRLRAANPPALPVEVAVLSLLLAGVTLCAYRAGQSRRLAKYRYLGEVYSE